MIVLMIVGIVFSVCGLIVMGACMTAQDMEAVIFGVIFGGIFVLVGVSLFYMWLRDFVKKRTIIKNGEKVWGTIVDYMDNTSYYINDIPALDIVVRCNYRGENKICRINTGQTNEGKYPLGASILLAVYQGRVTYFKNSVGGNGAAM